MLIADSPVAGLVQRETRLPDPDVEHVEMTVEVLLPETTKAGAGPRSSSRSTPTRAFGAEPGAAIDVEMAYADHKNLGPLEAADPLQPVPGEGAVTVPSAREVRLRLTAVCRADPGLDYFGTPAARRSASLMFVELHARSQDERGMFVPDTQGRQVQALFLQPDPAPGQPATARIAQQLSLVHQGLTLTGPAGGVPCSAALAISATRMPPTARRSRSPPTTT